MKEKRKRREIRAAILDLSLPRAMAAASDTSRSILLHHADEVARTADENGVLLPLKAHYDELDLTQELDSDMQSRLDYRQRWRTYAIESLQEFASAALAVRAPFLVFKGAAMESLAGPDYCRQFADADVYLPLAESFWLVARQLLRSGYVLERIIIRYDEASCTWQGASAFEKPAPHGAAGRKKIEVHFGAFVTSFSTAFRPTWTSCAMRRGPLGLVLPVPSPEDALAVASLETTERASPRVKDLVDVAVLLRASGRAPQRLARELPAGSRWHFSRLLRELAAGTPSLRSDVVAHRPCGGVVPWSSPRLDDLPLPLKTLVHHVVPATCQERGPGRVMSTSLTWAMAELGQISARHRLGDQLMRCMRSLRSNRTWVRSGLFIPCRFIAPEPRGALRWLPSRSVLRLATPIGCFEGSPFGVRGRVSEPRESEVLSSPM